jgi:hypothetical protein
MTKINGFFQRIQLGFQHLHYKGYKFFCNQQEKKREKNTIVMDKERFLFSLLSYWEMKGFEGCWGGGGIEHERLGNNFLHSVVWPERGLRRERGGGGTCHGSAVCEHR